ncbi:MAG: hypothetical protein V1755_14055 [Chloroflexota bacterium]
MIQDHEHGNHVHHESCPHCAGQHVPAQPRPREQVFVSDPGRVVKSCHDVVTAAGQIIITVTYQED